MKLNVTSRRNLPDAVRSANTKMAHGSNPIDWHSHCKFQTTFMAKMDWVVLPDGDGDGEEVKGWRMKMTMSKI